MSIKEQIRNTLMESFKDYEYSFAEDENKAVLKSTHEVERYNRIFMTSDDIMKKLPDKVEMERVEFVCKDDSADTFAMYIDIKWEG